MPILLLPGVVLGCVSQSARPEEEYSPRALLMGIPQRLVELSKNTMGGSGTNVLVIVRT